MRNLYNLLCLLCLITFGNDLFAQSEVQRVRINFENPEGYTRHLLLGFVEDNSATDDFDYGYDAPNTEDLPDDLNWIIEEGRYVIQGVGQFSTNKFYPLGMYLTNSGNVSISLAALENFDSEIDVYIYDLVLDSYTHLNELDLDMSLTADTYLDRFFVAFSMNAHIEIMNQYLLSVDSIEENVMKVWHSNTSKELHINGLSPNQNADIEIYNLEGKRLLISSVNSSQNIINTSNISSGIYVVRLRSEALNHTEKFCITN